MLAILEEDQREARTSSRKYMHAPRSDVARKARATFTLHSQQRAVRVLELLDVIGGEPTLENIGADGSQAVSVIALHSRLSVMRKILKAFEASYKKDPASVYYEAIPSLLDRVLIFERKKQKFGTQWMFGTDGKFFLPPVADFSRMNKRRAAHGLNVARHPRDLSYGIPKGPPPPETRASDQRVPTEAEYTEYVLDRLD